MIQKGRASLILAQRDLCCPECGLHVQRTLDANDPEGALERESLRWDAQARQYEEQSARTDSMQAKAIEQDARFDAVLDKWEEQVQRMDRLFDGLESLLHKLTRGV